MSIISTSTTSSIGVNAFYGNIKLTSIIYKGTIDPCNGNTIGTIGKNQVSVPINYGASKFCQLTPISSNGEGDNCIFTYNHDTKNLLISSCKNSIIGGYSSGSSPWNHSNWSIFI